MKKQRPYSIKDDETIRSLAGKERAEVIARKMNRTKKAIAYRAHKLGVSLKLDEDKAKCWVASGDHDRVVELAGTMPVGKIAKRLGRTKAAISVYANKLGVSLAFEGERSKERQKKVVEPPKKWVLSETDLLLNGVFCDG